MTGNDTALDPTVRLGALVQRARCVPGFDAQEAVRAAVGLLREQPAPAEDWWHSAAPAVPQPAFEPGSAPARIRPTPFLARWAKGGWWADSLRPTVLGSSGIRTARSSIGAAPSAGPARRRTPASARDRAGALLQRPGNRPPDEW
ncbi:hypothetical protein [Kitasatospora sp. CB02891]|uniref:hypothetical protein n=1 Tax=Kitasatospora sp. CB02891 TaxID=2020329 RepID=UPI0012FD207A|nr:hypothetical protein [Kitasatospora sp. CB02891]